MFRIGQCSMSKAGEAMAEEGLTLGFFEAVKSKDDEAEGEDILNEARAGVECAEVARGHKEPKAEKADVEARSSEGAGGAQVRARALEAHDTTGNIMSPHDTQSPKVRHTLHRGVR